MIIVFGVFIALPLILCILTLFSRDEIVDDIVSWGSISLFIMSIIFLATYLVYGGIYVISYSDIPVLGSVYGFIIDPLSAYIGSIIGIVASLILFYGVDYMSPNNNYHPVMRGRQRYFAWMFFFVFSALLFVYSSTLLQFLIGFELMSLACWGLISYYGSREASYSAFKMLLTTHLGAYGGLATAMGVNYYYTHSLTLTSLSALPDQAKTIVLALLMWAAITKSSQFPTYSWLPDAMVAPTPTSALLHGATMIEMGPYLIARTLYSMGNPPPYTPYIILIPACASMFIALIMYPVLRDGKRILAYSTIAEVAFMYFGVAVMTYSLRLGLILFTLHFTVHAFLKSIGFLTMGCVGYVSGTHDLGKTIGLITNNKFLLNMYLLSFLGLSGAPIYGISKIYVLIKAAYALGTPIMTNTVYAVTCVVMLVESLVLLAVTIGWMNIGFKREPVIDPPVSIPKRMYASLIILTILLYISQIMFFPIVKPLFKVI